MTTPDNPVALLSRALDQAGAVIAGVRPELALLPSPCRSWDVRTLVDHVVDEVHRFAEVAGYHVGPEVKVRDDAPLYDRLAALGGRDPN
jgi:hypothetical protein